MKNLFKTVLLLSLIYFGTLLSVYAQIGNHFEGNGAGLSITSGDYNTAVGDSAGYNVNTGSWNTLIGSRSGFTMSSASENTFLGYDAGYSNTTGTDNVFIGFRAGFFNTNATDNTFLGNGSGFNNTTGFDNTFLGHMTGANFSDGDDNTFIGNHAGCGSLTFVSSYTGATATPATGSDNTAVGSASGYMLTTGYRNAFLGNDAGYDCTSGYRNTFIGDSAGIDVGVGHHNTFVGQAAGSCTEHADYNTFVGSYAGWDNNRTNSTSNANHNTYLGYYCGFTNREGEYNAGIGSMANFNNTNRSRCSFLGAYANPDNNDVIVLGYNARVSGTYGITLGNESDVLATGAIGMGHLTQISTGSNYSIALGYQSSITDDNSIGIGYLSNISANYSIGIGSNVTVPGPYAVSIGSSSTADTNSVAIGYLSSATGSYSIALGAGAVTAQNNSMVLGGLTSTDRISVGIGTSTPNQNASIDLAENNKGFLISRMNNAQRTSFASVLTASDEGMMVYDTVDNSLYIWDGAAFNEAGSDNQDLNLTGNSLTITNDATDVDLSIYLDNTDAQDLELTGNILSLTNDATTVDLSAYLDNTDTQLTEAEVDAYANNNGYLTTEVDGDVTNEIQDLDLTGNTLSIENGNSVDLSAYLDNTDTQLTEAEVDAYANNNGYLTTEVDGDVTNEIQDLDLTGNTLSIENGNSVDLSAYLDNTDTQLTEAEVDAYANNNGYLTAEVDGDVTNEIQDLDLTGNTLSIENGNSVDLSAYLDNTDTQLTEAEVDAYANNNGYLTTEVDGDVTNEIQDLDLTGNTLSIENGNSVDLSAYLDNTDTQLTEAEVDAYANNNGYLTTEVDGDVTNEIQDLDLTGNTLSIENGNSVDLSAYLDNTDTQLTEAEVDAYANNNGYLTTEVDGDVTNEIQDLSLIGNTLSLSGDATTIDLSTYLDNQSLELDGNFLSIEDGNSVDLSAYLDDTDTDEQNLIFTGTELTIENGNTVDLVSLMDGTGTDDQTIELSANLLSIEDGNSVDLSAYLDNTDAQNLSLTGTELSIDNGNMVDLSALSDGTGTDDQNLTSASLAETTLTIEIENGTSVSVDLAPMLEEIYTILEDHEERITQLEADVAYLLSVSSGTIFAEDSNAQLYQNIPNPANNTTRIQCYVPQEINNAYIVIYDAKGVVLKEVPVVGRDLTFIDVDILQLAPANYFYSLVIDGKNAGTKQMSVE